MVNPDYVVMEIADGLYQRETKLLLNCHPFTNSVYAVLFSAGDSLSAMNGIEVLNRRGILPIGISGLLTASPLLISEVKENCNLPVYTLEDLTENAAEIVKKNRHVHIGNQQLGIAS